MAFTPGGGATPAVYSYQQLEQLWVSAGGKAALAPVAAAIAMAESGGNASATNAQDNNGTQTSWGLWQISNGTHSPPVPNILDPLANARQAVAKYNSAGGWSPWGTYDSGAYRKYLQGGGSVSDVIARGGQALVDEAGSFLGTPYVWGGDQPGGFDCSGLVQYSLEKLGLRNVPRTSEQQWQWVQHITEKQLQPGDLIFEQWPGEASPGHVAIYAGNGQIIQAPGTGQNVEQVSWSPGQVQQEGGQIVGYGRIPGLGKAQFAGSGTTAGGPTGTGATPATLTSDWVPSWARGALGAIQHLTDPADVFGFFQGIGGLSGVVQGVDKIANVITRAEMAVEWLLVPTHWVRIFAGLGGSAFVLMGIVTMSRTGRGYQVQVPAYGAVPAPGGQLAPALGIAEVTIGAVLLFIAFHNLPFISRTAPPSNANVIDFGSFLSHLQFELQNQGAQA